jgi:hypothetical protein
VLADALTRALRDVMLPAMAWLAAAEALSSAGVPLKLVGYGWDQAKLAGPAVRAAWPAGESARQQLAALAENVAVVVHVTPVGVLSAAVLHAPLAGLPIVAPQHPLDSGPGALPTLLHAGSDFLRPAPVQLVSTVRMLLQDAGRRGALAESARGRLLAAHTWAQRALR